MVLVPAGEFLRGRSHPLPDDALKWFPALLRDDRPVRKVWVDAFHLDEHEVTNSEYAAFVRERRHRPPYNWAGGRVPAGKEDFPVVDVSWEDADACCRWAGKRLPTEAEWERACRGYADGKVYPWGDDQPTAQLARFNALDGPCAVGRFKPNYFGLYDLAGNVWGGARTGTSASTTNAPPTATRPARRKGATGSCAAARGPTSRST